MRKITSFNASWSFSKDNSSWEQVNLPHTWNAIDGTDGGNDYYRGKCIYKKEFLLSELPGEKRHFLEINGANSSCSVVLNGTLLCTHDGGYSTFRVDMTDTLLPSNTLEISVDNSPNPNVYPQTADFTFYGGLYRDVNVISVPESHFDLSYYGGPGIMATPCVSGTVGVKVFVSGSFSEIRYGLYDASSALVCEEVSSSCEVTLDCPNPHLWNGLNDPYLYTVKAEILDNGEVVDCIGTQIGFRSFEIDPQRGFILNGQEYPLRGVSRHQDRKGKGNAISRADHEEDMALIREVGATTIRLAHYQHDQYFYDLCDRYGLVVWAEIPYISNHISGGRENTISQMKELVVQNYNHASIVVWGLSNEITMSGAEDPDLLDNHRVLNDLCHSLDSTRLTTCAVLTTCPIDASVVHLSDVVSYNHYFGWYGGDVADNGPWFDNFHKKYPNRAIGCSEYGCEALNWHTSRPMQGDYTEEYQAYYHEELIKQLYSRKYLWATHVWNMFDFGADARAEGGENGQNHKGLVTFDRAYKKDSFYAYKAWLSEEKFVHICGKRYTDRVEDQTIVTVYSNLDSVSLYVNETLLETKSANDHFFKFTVPNAGRSTLRAVSGEYSDESVINKVDTFNESYRLKEVGAVLNWFDVTEKEGYYSLNSKIGEVFRSLRGKVALMMFLLKKVKGLKKKKDGSDAGNPASSMDKKTMMKMLESFTVLRATTMAGMIGITFTKEELLAMNRKLNRIRAR